MTVHVAHHDLSHNKRRTFLGLLAATIGFGLVFLGVTAYEWAEILNHFDPRENLYLSAFFTITGLHMLHVVAGLVMLIVAKRLHEQSFWIVRFAHKREGTVIVPNAISCFTLMEGFFGVLIIAL